ncbi:type VII toxin-antitoxin system MntA family adenylyltransferase antitoxin [Halovivax gelatinilyticus]|uniref:type VII toxin-antitoxin system MntA family adenylyltransferase antitoxin n=1 Tax=Halovivax gelatinilyticus TaxID=2961597 RepID=UPI0020CA3CE8|nr:nucleotidyltransferase domain-containing protein [Halovivax gelatinilyticus]
MVPTELDDRAVREAVTGVLSEHPVDVGILFGSWARGDVHARSDIDVGVALDGIEPNDPAYNDVILGIGVDLSLALGTDDVDVVDLRSARSSLVRAALDHGIVLVGDDRSVDRLRDAVERDDESRSPADRFDEILARIDDLLA